jgi:type II secretory pathway component PulL
MSKDITCLALPPDLLGPWAYRRSGGAAAWAKTEAEKHALSGSLSGADDLILILAGENIRRFSLDLPGLRGKELRAATAFELEDHMGGALSDELICYDRKKSGDVALISDALRGQLAQILSQYNLNPSQILIDYDLLGDGQNVKIGDRLLQGGANGFVINTAWADLIPNAPAFETLTPDALLAQFEARAADNSALDLRAGLGLKTAQNMRWQRGAKLAALAAGIIILPIMLDHFAEARAWQKQAQADSRAAAALYEQAAGEPTDDAARALSQRLKAGQSAAGFLDLSAALFTASETVEGVEIDSLRYDARQNALQLTLRYPNFESGAALEQAVRQSGGDLVVGGIRERGESLIGEASLTLTRGARK